MMLQPRNPMRRFFRHGLLPQLVAFEACVRLGSVTLAAEELCVAQPTVSCMLRKLADTFEGPLTVIRDRRVEATPLGREVLQLCDDLFAAFARFEERRETPSRYDQVSRTQEIS
jgi:DNA-binding transcriptional LysR family regulator